MDESMKFSIVFLVSMAFTAAASNALAAPLLADPTRPPASFAQQGDNASVDPTGKPVLQSVIISPARKVAVISGQTLRLGDRFGDARLVKITETEVVLRAGNEYQSLKLYPQIEKKASSNRLAPGSEERAK